jgi:hypothetical protein
MPVMDWKKALAIGIPVLTLLAITLQLYHTQKQIQLSNKEEDESFKKFQLGNTETEKLLQSQINNLQLQIDSLKANNRVL